MVKPNNTEEVTSNDTPAEGTIYAVTRLETLKQQAYMLQLERENNNFKYQEVQRLIANKEKEVWAELKPLLEEEAKENKEETKDAA